MNRVELDQTKRPTPPGAERVGDADPNEIVNLAVIVRRKNVLPISPASSAPVDRSDFADRFGADPADVAKIEAFAKEHQLQVVDSDMARRRVELSGTLGDLSAAFGAEVATYTQDDRTFRARSGKLSVPPELVGIVEGVFGFDQRPQAQSHLRRRARFRPHLAGDTSYTPKQVAQLYGFPSEVDGTGQTIAIIELGGGYQDSDLSTYWSNLSIATPPKVTAVQVDGGSNTPVGNPSSADSEVLLDIEVAGAVAPGASIAVYFAPNTTQGFLDAITQAVHDQTNKPNVISISWGGPESSWTGQAFTQFDQAFQDAGALGVTVCAASGDDGSNDGVGDGRSHVDFPASSPNVLACGGTRLIASGNSIESETVWNGGTGNGASGGGVSEQFTLPSYQSSVNVPISSSSSQFAGRGVPDVSGDADPGTGYNVLVDGQNGVVGGTSAVAPLWASLIALVNQKLGKPVGFINPVLYGSGNASAFNDINSGNNGAYTAGPGWDACTGWGSPIGSGILQLLGGSPAPTDGGTTSPPPPSTGGDGDGEDDGEDWDDDGCPDMGSDLALH